MRRRTYSPKDTLYRNGHNGVLHFSDADIVDLFLNVHSDWFTSADNGFCGKRQECREILLTYLTTGVISNVTIDMPVQIPAGRAKASVSPANYVCGKFQEEWLPYFKVESEV